MSTHNRPKRVSLRKKELILRWSYTAIVLSLLLGAFRPMFLLVTVAGLVGVMLVLIWIDPL
jgi:hypothetical protein